VENDKIIEGLRPLIGATHSSHHLWWWLLTKRTFEYLIYPVPYHGSVDPSGSFYIIVKGAMALQYDPQDYQKHLDSLSLWVLKDLALAKNKW
jgi:hypothetical protein